MTRRPTSSPVLVVSTSLKAGSELATTLADQGGAGAGVLMLGSVIAAGEARALLLPVKLAEQREADTDALLRVGPSRSDLGLDDKDGDW